MKWIVFLISVRILLSVIMEQHVNAIFCVKLGKSTTEMHDLLKNVYGDEFVSLTQVFKWFKSLNGTRFVSVQ